MQTERRKHARVQWVMSGEIAAANNHGQTVRCLVHDLSEGGARLTMIDAGRLPNTFKISVGPGEPFHDCRVVWGSQRAVGIAFLIPLVVLPTRKISQDNDTLLRHGCQVRRMA